MLILFLFYLKKMLCVFVWCFMRKQQRQFKILKIIIDLNILKRSDADRSTVRTQA